MSEGDGAVAHIDREAAAKLHSAVVADVLDDLAYRGQAMDPGIVALDVGRPLFGRALTVTATTVVEIPEEPYRRELEAVDALKPDDVLVASVAGPGQCGFWGELLTTAARGNGAVGAVIDGYTRDSSAIVERRFPPFARGCSLVVPADVASEAVRAALEKVSRESEMRAALERGMGVIEAYERYGVL